MISVYNPKNTYMNSVYNLKNAYMISVYNLKASIMMNSQSIVDTVRTWHDWYTMLNNLTIILHPLLLCWITVLFYITSTFVIVYNMLLTSQGLYELACATAFMVDATSQLWTRSATARVWWTGS